MLFFFASLKNNYSYRAKVIHTPLIWTFPLLVDFGRKPNFYPLFCIINLEIPVLDQDGQYLRQNVISSSGLGTVSF